MINKLPIFQGYYVDVRLKQFRKISNDIILFIDFDSDEGKIMLLRYLKSLESKSTEFD